MALFYESNEKAQSPAFENLTDVDLDQNTLANGQVPVYNATTRKWENAVVDVENKFNSDNVAPIETGNVASRSYTKDSHLIGNGKYYQTTRSIASGETFTNGVNIQAISIEDALTGNKIINGYTVIKNNYVRLENTYGKSMIIDARHEVLTSGGEYGASKAYRIDDSVSYSQVFKFWMGSSSAYLMFVKSYNVSNSSAKTGDIGAYLIEELNTTTPIIKTLATNSRVTVGTASGTYSTDKYVTVKKSSSSYNSDLVDIQFIRLLL